MHRPLALATLIASFSLLPACERQPTLPPPATTNPVAEHLKKAGEELTAAATHAASQAGPTLERAAAEARALATRADEKLTAMTQAATQPATQPATIPNP